MTATTDTTTDTRPPANEPEHDCFRRRSLRARARDWVRPEHAIHTDGWSRYEIVVSRPARGRIGTAWAWLRERTWTARVVLLADEDDPQMPTRQDLATVYADTRLDVIQAARHLAVDIEHRQPLMCGGLLSLTCPVTIAVVDVVDFDDVEN